MTRLLKDDILICGFSPCRISNYIWFGRNAARVPKLSEILARSKGVLEVSEVLDLASIGRPHSMSKLDDKSETNLERN